MNLVTNPEELMAEIRNSKDPMAGDFAKRFDRNLEKTKDRSKIAPPGAIKGIPPLLEQKRLEHLIPDGAFKTQPVYDYVFVYQINGHVTEEGTYGEDSKIYVPETIQAADRQMVPTGVLVSAGLTALDSLWSHGIGLGDTVYFAQLAPYRLPIGMRDGKEEYVILLRSGLVRASFEQRAKLQSGELTMGAMAIRDSDGQVYYRHVLKDADGRLRKPLDVEIWEEM
jgi:hypothetical protein